MQRSRRSNPYPFTWEIPAAALVAVLLVAVLALQTGRTLANAVAGNGWVFIDRPHLFTSVPGILDGDAAAGLTGIATPSGPRLLWTCIALVLLAAVAGCALAVRAGLRRWGPARLRGVATPAQAEALLGRTRLRAHAKIIRPDLYGTTKDHRR
jgi:hypothetical protein